MGKFKLKKLAHVMPHAWFSMLKEKGIKRHSPPHNKRPPSQGKLFAAHKNKHSYKSSLNHKAIDTHFPSTPKKSCSKACREEFSAKQPFCKQLESLHGGNHSCSTGTALPRSLCKCTMSPASRKIYSGIIDDEEISFNTHHSNIMSHNHTDPCNNIKSKEKSFHLDVQELEAKLKALSSQERLRNIYISPLFSVAVPSPSLDGVQEYSNHDSLGTSLRYSLEGLKCRKIEENFFYEGSTSSISFSPCSSSSSGTCINKKASRSTVWEREFNSFDDSHDLFTTIEAKGKKNTSLNEGEAGLGSRMYMLQAQSAQQNMQNNDVGRRRFPLMQKVNEGDINQTRPVTPNRIHLYGQSRPTKSHTDDLSLSDSELACTNYRRFKMLQNVKRELLLKSNSENKIKAHDTPGDVVSDAQIQLLKSPSTRSLDSSVSQYAVPTMGAPFLYDALPFGDQLGNPSLSESSSKKFPLLLNANNIDKGMKGFRDYDALMTLTPSVSKASLHSKASSLHLHKSTMEIEDQNITPLMHQDKLYYQKSPKHFKSSHKGDTNFSYAHQYRPFIFKTASKTPICGKHVKKMRGDDKQYQINTDMKPSACCRSSRCNKSLSVNVHHRNHQENENKDMYICDYLCPVDDGSRDSVRTSSYSIDSLSDDTSSDIEYVKKHEEVMENVKPSFSRSSNRRSLGDHLGMQCHHQNEANCHHQYVCSTVEPGRCRLTARNRVITRSPCRSEVHYNKDIEASMMSRRSCSDGQHNNDVGTSMVGRLRSSTNTQQNEDIEARMIGWRRCSRSQFDVKGKESRMNSVQYDKDNRVSTMSVQNDKTEHYNTDIEEPRRSCISVVQYDKSRYNVPVQREELDIEERMIGRRNCSSVKSEKSTSKFVEHDKEIESRTIQRSCRQYDMDKEARMIIGGRVQERRSGSWKPQYDKDKEESMSGRRRSCSRAKYEKEKEERCRRVSEYDRSEDDVVLQAKVMWSYNMRQDFRESMMDALYNVLHVHVHAHADDDDRKVNEEALLELVGCYLALNPPSHHASILHAFGDLCSHLFH